MPYIYYIEGQMLKGGKPRTNFKSKVVRGKQRTPARRDFAALSRGEKVNVERRTFNIEPRRAGISLRSTSNVEWLRHGFLNRFFGALRMTFLAAGSGVVNGG